MPRILITCRYDSWCLARQTPECSGKWGDYQFIFQPDGEAVDGWVVLDDLPSRIDQKCSPDTTLLITGEPESVRRYRSRFTCQFGGVWTSHRSIQHPSRLLQNEGQHWHYGMRKGSVHTEPLTYDDLCRLGAPKKPKLASVICSNKAVTPDHRRRVEFVQELKRRLGDQVEVFGRGIRSMDDKSEAIWPFKYHVVLENDHSDFFMTEKISDAYLGYSYPIYFGGTEADNRFAPGSFARIDIYDPESAFSKIEQILNSTTYEDSLALLCEARQRVLTDNNILSMIAEYFDELLSGTVRRPQQVTLREKSDRVNLVIDQVRRTLSPSFNRSGLRKRPSQFLQHAEQR